MSKSWGQKCWYQQKGLTERNTHVSDVTQHRKMGGTIIFPKSEKQNKMSKRKIGFCEGWGLMV